MKYILSVFTIVFLLNTFVLLPNGNAELVENENSLTLSLSQDPTFGFYPSVNGYYQINNTWAFTYYGVFWTQDLLGGNQGGLNLPVEFGIGINYSLFDGLVSINPVLGVGHGNYQSGGGRPVIGDDIVPSLFITLSSGNSTYKFGSVNWLSLRKENNTEPLRNQFENYLVTNHQYTKLFSYGLYIDLFSTKNIYPNGKIETEISALWIGPSISFTSNSSANLWFSLGADLVDYVTKVNKPKIEDFYKLVLEFEI